MGVGEWLLSAVARVLLQVEAWRTALSIREPCCRVACDSGYIESQWMILEDPEGWGP